MAQGALSAEPGQREQGAEQGRQAGMALGPLAEVGMTGLRKAGSSIWGWLHNNPDVRMATAAGADVGPVAGLKPGGAIAANRAEAKGRYGVSAGDVAAEKAVGPATDVINERLDATYGPLHDEQQAFFSSSQGQKRVASRPLSEAIDEAGQRFGLSDQLPVPGSEAKAAKFATLAARLVKGETPEAMSLDQVGRSPSMERDFNAEDLMKIKRRFHDAAAPTSEFDNGEKGAFSALEGEVGKMIEQHYPGLHQINQVAAQDIGQAKGGMQALGFPEETKKLNIGKAVPKTNGLGKQGPAPDLNSDLLTMLPPPGEVPRGPAPDLGAGPTPPGRLPPGRPLGGGRTPLPPKLPKQGPPPDLDSERITIPSPPPPAPTPSPQPAPERPAPSPENNLEPHFLQLKRAFLSGDPDAIKASEVFLRNNPEALQFVRDAQGTEAFGRLKGAASPGLHVNAGLTGKPHGVASGLTKGATYRLASAKNIPGGAGAAVGQAVTRADVAGLMQMLGLGQQEETSP
jgi:hypothetical protein